MPKRHRSVEFYAPTAGIRTDLPSTLVDPRNITTGENFKNYYGVNQKEYGTSLYATGTGSVFTSTPNAIFNCAFPDANVLQIMTPAGVYTYTASGDTYVSDGRTFTGTYTDFWSGLVYNGDFIYANGKDPVQVKTSYNVTGTNMASLVSPTTYTAYAVAALNDHLCLYHVFANGDEFYKRVMWSIKGALTLVAGTTDFASGLAGAQDIQDCEGEIQTAAQLGMNMIVYAERSIHLQTYVGGQDVYNFYKMVSGVGTPSRRGVLSYGDINYIFSQDNIYAYYGGYDVRPIGDEVRRTLYAEYNSAAANTVFLEYDPAESELIVAVPTGTSTMPNTNYVYRVQTKSWSRKLRNHTCAGNYTRQTGLTIGQLIGPIGAQNYTFGEQKVSVDSIQRLYGDPGGQIVKADPTTYTLSQTGTNVIQTYSVDSMDFVGDMKQSPNTGANDQETGDITEFTTTYKRWQRLTLDMKGYGTASINYSTDQGNTYATFGGSPITLSSTGKRHLLDFDLKSQYVRFQIVNTGTYDYLGWTYAKLDYVPGGNF